jgi:hypothetical protein
MRIPLTVMIIAIAMLASPTNRHARNERKAVRDGCWRWRSYLNPTDAAGPGSAKRFAQ